MLSHTSPVDLSPFGITLEPFNCPPTGVSEPAATMSNAPLLKLTVMFVMVSVEADLLLIILHVKVSAVCNGHLASSETRLVRCWP